MFKDGGTLILKVFDATNLISTTMTCKRPARKLVMVALMLYLFLKHIEFSN